MNYSSLMSEAVRWRRLQDNAASTVLLDEKENQNGTLHGGGTTADRSVAGPDEWTPLALGLDGIADRCELPTPDLSAAGAIAVRFKLNAIPDSAFSNTFLMGSRNGNTNSRIYANFPSGTRNLQVLFAQGAYTQLGELVLDRWYSLIITWEGNDAAFYLDGLLAAEQTRTYAGGWLGYYTLGAIDQGSPWSATGGWLYCDVADSPCWNRKLTAEEAMVWHAGAGGVVPGIIPNLRGEQVGPGQVRLTWADPFPVADTYDIRVDSTVVATEIVPEVI